MTLVEGPEIADLDSLEIKHDDVDLDGDIDVSPLPSKSDGSFMDFEVWRRATNPSRARPLSETLKPSQVRWLFKKLLLVIPATVKALVLAAGIVSAALDV